MPSSTASAPSIVSRTVVRALEDKDLSEAALIVRLAFGTFLGAPDPSTFWDDRDYVHGRHRAPHVAGFGASLDGKLIGSNFATRWGSVGFFGPLTVRPELQESGIARKLLDRTMAQFHSWDSRHVGLFTFAQSAKHVALYQKYGFYPRFLTAIMSASADASPAATRWSRFSDLYEKQRSEALNSCRELTDKLYPGLDLSDEIRTTHEQGLGDTVLIEGVGGLAGFAVCHYGPKAKPVPAIASSNSAQCVTAPRPSATSAVCSMPARRWRAPSACRGCSPAPIWRGPRPTSTSSRAASAPTSRASLCTGTTIPATAAPASTSSMIGGNSLTPPRPCAARPAGASPAASTVLPSAPASRRISPRAA